MSNDSIQVKHWFVFYTKSRQEKKIRDLLTRRGFEVFLPLQKVMRQWSDRKKKVEVPLFNSYIFVFESEDQIPFIVQTPGIAWNLRHNNKPAVLHPNELQTITRFLDSGLLLESQPYTDLSVGDPVEVIDGPLKGMLGMLLKTTDGEKFTVGLESIGQTMLVRIDPGVLKKRI
ncbi:MAG: UpxY family transcription antiterminator [Cyclobacteriaceae bacterium]|nr:UpxY family transcription antiterminator [Cyclobacteriaceae bacterium]